MGWIMNRLNPYSIGRYFAGWDDGLRSTVGIVLILILLEGTLLAFLYRIRNRNRGLNPYSIGRYFAGGLRSTIGIWNASLNPYSIGRYFAGNHIMVTLKIYPFSGYGNYSTCWGLNPYSIGRYFAGENQFVYMSKDGGVLILILLEGTLLEYEQED